MKRALLIETRHEEAFRHHRVEVFPFLLGFLRDAGWHGEWWILNVPQGFMHQGTRYVLNLPETGKELLLNELKSLTPHMIVFHDRPCNELLSELMKVAPEAGILDLTNPTLIHFALGERRILITNDDRTPIKSINHFKVRDLMKIFPGSSAQNFAGKENREFIYAAPPCFERRFLGSPGEKPYRQPVRLLVKIFCPYRRRIGPNRFYRTFEDEKIRGYLGCTFCNMSHTRNFGSRKSQFEHVLRQIESHGSAALPDEKLEYHFDGSVISTYLPDFLEEMLDRGIKPSSISTLVRADVFLKMRQRLEELLPRMRDAGHSLKILSIGAENFSEEENERFNKGLTVKKIWECFEMIRDFERRFAGTFSSEIGYFAGILFTPWTRPSDLLENMKAAQRLGIEWLMKVIGTRLQLFEGLPITELARRDGLIAEQFGGAADIAAVCQSHPDLREIPWRFADPRVEFIHRILIRLEPVPQQALFPKDDPLYLEIKSLRDLLPERFSKDYPALITAIIKTVEKEGTAPGVSGIFRKIAQKAREDLAKKRARSGKPPAVPDNIQFDVTHSTNKKYRFHVSVYQKDLPYFRRVGNFSLRYSHKENDRISELFVRILLTVMNKLSQYPPSLENLEIWRETLKETLERYGYNHHFIWTVRWMDFLD